MNGFAVNQVVKGIHAGTFKIIGFYAAGVIGNEAHAKLKAYDPASGKVARGQLALPLTAIVAI